MKHSRLILSCCVLISVSMAPWIHQSLSEAGEGGGSRCIDWRLHVNFDLGAFSIADVEVTDVKGGETLKRLDKPGESLVVTKWQSVFYWEQWFESKERSEIQEKIDQLLPEETLYEIYEYDPM